MRRLFDLRSSVNRQQRTTQTYMTADYLARRLRVVSTNIMLLPLLVPAYLCFLFTDGVLYCYLAQQAQACIDSGISLRGMLLVSYLTVKGVFD